MAAQSFVAMDRNDPVRVTSVRPAPAGPTGADPAAIVEVEQRHGQALFGFVRRLGLSDDQAQDCVQEALFRLWVALGGETAILDPKAWIYRTAYRLAMDEHRLRRRVARLMELVSERAGREAQRPDDTDRIAVWREVDRLPPRQRHILYLRYRADLPYEDIAGILGITASAARSHATQAMQTLRSRLGSDERQDGIA